jgi:hypothetical protein
MNLQQDCLLAPSLFSSTTTSEISMNALAFSMATIHNQPVVSSRKTYFIKQTYLFI